MKQEELPEPGLQYAVLAELQTVASQGIIADHNDTVHWSQGHQGVLPVVFRIYILMLLRPK